MTLTAVLGGVALAGAAGINPWVAVLVVGLLERADLVGLAAPWAWLGSAGLLVVVGVGALVSTAAGLRRRGAWSSAGWVGWAAVLVAGAVLFDAHAGAHIALFLSLGLGAAGSAVLHGVRAAARGTNAAAAPRGGGTAVAAGGGSAAAPRDVGPAVAAGGGPAATPRDGGPAARGTGSGVASNADEPSNADGPSVPSGTADRRTVGRGPVALLEDVAAALLVVVAFSLPSVAGALAIGAAVVARRR